jgi:hypothetical protein
MRWLVSARRSALIILITTALVPLPPVVNSAVGAPACRGSASPDLAFSLIDLQQALGDVMGSPVACPQVDAEGNIIQVTTTGLAVYRPDGMSVFASGEHHWALTAQGLSTWTGNWHNGLYPPVTPPPAQDQTEPGQPTLATIEVMTVVQVQQDVSNRVVVQDADGSMYTVETASGCPDLVTTLGNHIFIRTGGLQTDMILLPQDETCAVAEMTVAAGN